MMQGMGEIMGGRFGYGMGGGLLMLIILVLAGIGLVAIIRWAMRK